MDNLLRGGFPISVRFKDEKDVIYIYSRKHGDLERDYNSFKLNPTYFSQGNGNYRDTNQNRRNDVWINPDVGYLNIQYFMNLIMLDGFNPLFLKGFKYHFEENESNGGLLKSLIVESSVAKILKFFEKSFVPYELIDYIQSDLVEINVPLSEFINAILINCVKEEDAEHGEGFWTDHCFYNLDLIESYTSLFPDKFKELLTEMKVFSFYEDEYYVAPRSEKYILHRGSPRQLSSVKKDKSKMDLLNQRKENIRKVRINNGKGEVYYTTLFTKLLCILINKMASIDANSVGIEMEADKPNWDDALSGLPSLFGSSSSETFELKRLVILLINSIEQYNLHNIEVIFLPVELSVFFGKIMLYLKKNTVNINSDSNFIYWDSCYKAKEKYRDAIRYGICGDECVIQLEEIMEFLNMCLVKLDYAADKAFNKELGLYDTYFINQPTQYEVIGENSEGFQNIRIKGFKQIPLTPFLEAQVHALKLQDGVSNRNLYSSVKKSKLFDDKLHMYKVNGSLEDMPMEIGRLKVFSPGWLENESVFLHMEYKYLLELLKNGLHEEYFEDMRKAMIPFLDAHVYGRSIFENSSFIASSANPDKSVHGRGYVARLSGSTAEVMNMVLVMAFGKDPFTLNDVGELELEFKPILPEWMFTKVENQIVTLENGKEKEVILEADTFSVKLFGKTLVVYHNPKRMDTFGAKKVNISKIELVKDHEVQRLFGSVITAPFSYMVRDRAFDRIDIWFDF